MKVLFLGSSQFSCAVLESLLSSSHGVCAVVSQPPRPSGRGHKLEKTPVQKMAEERGLPIFTFEKLGKSLDQIEKIDYDIAVVASYGQILTDAFLNLRPCINVHPSLLPKYRGATPIESALLNGDKQTGVTIMKVVREVDAGDIILQEPVDILPDERFNHLQERLSRLGGILAVKAVDLYKSGRVKFVPQDADRAVFVKKITKEDGFLDFALPADVLYNKFRALGENRGCFFGLGGTRLRVFDIAVVDMTGKPFEVLCSKKRLIIACSRGAIEVQRLQSPSGKQVDAASFLNGWKGGLEVDRCLPI